jgi:hypothetical protein
MILLLRWLKLHQTNHMKIFSKCVFFILKTDLLL